MKKLIFVVTLILCSGIMLLSADIKKIPFLSRNKSIKKNCVGFTIIEAGKGINCYGDTIRLTKTNGFYAVKTGT